MNLQKIAFDVFNSKNNAKPVTEKEILCDMRAQIVERLGFTGTRLWMREVLRSKGGKPITLQRLFISAIRKLTEGERPFLKYEGQGLSLTKYGFTHWMKSQNLKPTPAFFAQSLLTELGTKCRYDSKIGVNPEKVFFHVLERSGINPKDSQWALFEEGGLRDRLDEAFSLLKNAQIPLVEDRKGVWYLTYAGVVKSQKLAGVFDYYQPNVTSLWVRDNPKIVEILKSSLDKSCGTSAVMNLTEDHTMSYLTNLICNNGLASFLERGKKVKFSNLQHFCYRRAVSQMRSWAQDAGLRASRVATTDTERKKKKEESNDDWGLTQTSYNDQGVLQVKARHVANSTSSEGLRDKTTVDKEDGHYVVEMIGGNAEEELSEKLHMKAAMRRVETLLRTKRPRNAERYLTLFEGLLAEKTHLEMAEELNTSKSNISSWIQQLTKFFTQEKETGWLEEYH